MIIILSYLQKLDLILRLYFQTDNFQLFINGTIKYRPTILRRKKQVI